MDSLPCNCWGCRQTPSLPTSTPQLPLLNMFEALVLEREVIKDAVEAASKRLPRGKESTPWLKIPSTKERRVIIVGNFLLGRSEDTICCSDPIHWEVCCLPGAGVRDITRRLPSLVCLSDYYTLLIVQVDNDKVTERSLRVIKRDFMGVGQTEGKVRVQAMFSSILSVAGKAIERIRKTHVINVWPRVWCHHRNFGFFFRGAVYSVSGLMAAGGDHLGQRGKIILPQELSRLINELLNWVWRWKWVIVNLLTT